MTDKEVLQRAIEIAGKNGYHAKFSERNCIDKYTIFKKYYKIIFSHDFAKAFWGEGDNDQVCKTCDHYVSMDKLWQYHLQQMVLKPNPIDYLREFVDNAEKP